MSALAVLERELAETRVALTAERSCTATVQAQRDAAYDEIAKLSRRFALALARPTTERDAP